MIAAYRDELAEIDRALMSSEEEDDEDDDVDEIQPSDYDAFPDSFVLDVANGIAHDGDVAMKTDGRTIDATEKDTVSIFFLEKICIMPGSDTDVYADMGQ